MTPNQETALREYLNKTIIPLIEDVLAKKLGQALDFVATEIAPPKRKEWVELNLDDIPDIFVGDISFCQGAKWAQAKLKEKNGEAI